LSRLGGTCCCHLHSHIEDDGNMLICHVGEFVRDYTASHTLLTSIRILNIYNIGIIKTRERTVFIYENSGNILATLRTGVICTVRKGRHMLMTCFGFLFLN
jgi:hypothetical protein